MHDVSIYVAFIAPNIYICIYEYWAYSVLIFIKLSFYA